MKSEELRTDKLFRVANSATVHCSLFTVHSRREVANSATHHLSLVAHPFTHRSRRGQALFELAFGMFALTLVVSALCGFALYIAKSLKMQNSLRVGAASQHDSVEVSDFAAQYIFGTQTVPVKEKVEMPERTIFK